jgi:hypothetical protein
MHIAADRTGDIADALRRQLGIVAVGQHQFRAMGEKPRRAALVGLDMRLSVADQRHHGGTIVASARQLAAVPLATQIA